MAFGARRTTHSAIVGPASPNYSECDHGLNRETACMQLAQRALDFADKSHLLLDPSARGVEVGALVRAMVWSKVDHNWSRFKIAESSLKLWAQAHARRPSICGRALSGSTGLVMAGSPSNEVTGQMPSYVRSICLASNPH